MKQTWNAVQTAFVVIGGMIGRFLGGADGFLYALIAFAIIDYVTGVLRGAFERKLSSEIGFRGIVRKVMIFVMVAIGNMIDRSVIGNGEVIRTAVVFFYLSNEGVSILENASAIGLPIPAKLRDVLAQLHNKDGDKK